MFNWLFKRKRETTPIYIVTLSKFYEYENVNCIESYAHYDALEAATKADSRIHEMVNDSRGWEYTFAGELDPSLLEKLYRGAVDNKYACVTLEFKNSHNYTMYMTCVISYKSLEVI